VDLKITIQAILKKVMLADICGKGATIGSSLERFRKLLLQYAVSKVPERPPPFTPLMVERAQAFMVTFAQFEGGLVTPSIAYVDGYLLPALAAISVQLCT
jgi:hypothetical protein